MRKLWNILAVLVVSGGLAVIPATSAYAVDLPIGKAWMPDQATGCQAYVSGRNVHSQVHQPGPNSPIVDINGPSFAIQYDNFGQGGCNWVRFNEAIYCPSLGILTWVLSEPAYYQYQNIAGISWIIPPIIGYPTCQFFGWYLELNGHGQSH